MRRTGVILAGFAALFSSCTEELAVPDETAKGEVVISLASDGSTSGVPGLKSGVIQTASDAELPDLADFEVEIYNSSGIRLYRDTYAETEGLRIPLNAGEYRLLAQHGDSLGIGFNSVWYAADTVFTVHGQTVEELSAVARMSKVKVAVEYGTNLQLRYSQYHSRVRLDGSASRYLKFEKNETRAGYMPAGSLGYEFYAMVDGEWKYYPAEPVECRPNDFITFHAEIDTGTGDLSLVTVRIDDSMNVIEKQETIPADAAPKDPPAIALYGFDENKTYVVMEAEDSAWVQAGIEARGGIRSCMLNIQSDYLADLGVPQGTDIDLADPSLDAGIAEALRSVGIRWPREMSGARFANLDFSAMENTLKYEPGHDFSATFALTVTDALDRTVSETFSVANKSPEGLAFTASDWNAYALSLRHFKASIAEGNPYAVCIQYRKEGVEEWSEAYPSQVNGTEAVYADIEGLAPSTSYQVRAIYNHNENFATDPVTLVTEAAAQMPNSGFEEWTDEFFTFKLGWSIFSKEVTIQWYRPWMSAGEERWWDVNSKYTMPGDYSYISLNQNTANFPSAGYTISDVCSGSKSAKIFTVWTGYSIDNVDRLSNGELFIGTANDDGTHATEGRPFSSRPDMLSFSYKYEAMSGENFYVLVQLKDAAGEVFAVAQTATGPASSSWDTMSLPLEYSDVTRKAASVYIIFKSTSSSNPSYTERSFTLGASGGVENSYSSGCNIGSVLCLDDLRLIYR